MKPFLTSPFLSLGLVAITFLTGCQAMEGLKEDIASIDFSEFTPAVTQSEEEKHSNFLIDGDCPKIEIVNELSMLTKYANPQTPSANTKTAHVAIENANSTCEYGNRSVTVDLKLNFNGTLGPQGSTGVNSYPYFVAVTSPSDKILAKEIFAAKVSYDAGQTSKTHLETLRQIIPADSRAEGSRYKIMIGFQLTKAQLAENRAIIEQRRLAEEARQLEIQRMEMEKAAAEKAAKEAASKPPTEITIQQTTPVQVQRAGPIDITTP